MSLSRKGFLKTLCLSGACIGCLSAMGNKTPVNALSDTDGQDKPLHQTWLGRLLSNMHHELDEEKLRSILKGCSVAHYDELKMNELLSPYIGNKKAFIEFLEKEWGWKIDLDKTSRVLIADENKDYCVCPVVNYEKGVDSSALCYCSEGFAEKMFSVVWESPVSARVISSVRRGDKSCRYEVILPAT
jgi:hypothetical protein